MKENQSGPSAELRLIRMMGRVFGFSFLVMFGFFVFESTRSGKALFEGRVGNLERAVRFDMLQVEAWERAYRVLHGRYGTMNELDRYPMTNVVVAVNTQGDRFWMWASKDGVTCRSDYPRMRARSVCQVNVDADPNSILWELRQIAREETVYEATYGHPTANVVDLDALEVPADLSYDVQIVNGRAFVRVEGTKGSCSAYADRADQSTCDWSD